MEEDHLLALRLQFEEDDCTVDNNWKPDKENGSKVDHSKGSLVDPTWELIDPTPDIHALFLQFNIRFFGGTLEGIEVIWSPRMTSCAGVCVYQGRSGFCSVRLSAPLLRLRPRKDLIETLLHEMIHAYLFVTHNNKDHDGHGPEFHKHMHRINKDAGTNITVYHSFHDEVRLYQQHWWRCNGPCQMRPPFFGLVRRSMNRAPGPNDNWWASHKANCNGQFIKIKEPEKKKAKDNQKINAKDIRTYFPGNKNPSLLEGSESGFKKPANPGNVDNIFPGFRNNSGSRSTAVPKNVVGFKDLAGPSNENLLKKGSTSFMNNVVGFNDLSLVPTTSKIPSFSGKGNVLGGSKKGSGFGGLLQNKGSGTFVLTGKGRGGKSFSSEVVQDAKNEVETKPKPFSGQGHVLGKAGNSSNSNLPNKHFGKSQNSSTVSLNKKIKLSEPETVTLEEDFVVEAKVNCPICNKTVNENDINSHLDVCVNDPSSEQSNSEKTVVDCPICNKKIDSAAFEEHLNDCIGNSFSEKTDFEDDINCRVDRVNCPICGESFLKTELDMHLENCAQCSVQDLSGVFDDNYSDDEEEDAAVGVSSRRTNKEGERLYPCPVCLKMIEQTKMNQHLDSCFVN